ncbi:MAG: ABC transporter permease [Cyclobacteriaceae bacterium]|nr:ABC transporter permease [Cyclobacteriaceae bacterium]
MLPVTGLLETGNYKMMKSNPPKLPLRFFRWFCHPKLRDSIEGDLMELYEERKFKNGEVKADVHFIKDVLLLFRPGIIKPTEGTQTLNTYGMYRSYLKIGWRNLLKSKIHAFINISGLTLGIVSVFFMAMFVKHELGYDRHYPQPENLYRITVESENPQTRTPHPMAQALVDDFPEVESAVSLSPIWAAGLTRAIYSMSNPENDIRFDEKNLLAVDTTFFDVFGFPVVRGDARKALRNVNAILISESTAKKYFGEADPIGKQLIVYPDSALLEVMAVFKDVPQQSHFHFDMLVSYVREKSFDPDDEYYTWADFGHFNYIRLKPGTDAKALEAKLMPWIRKYVNWSDEYYRSVIAGKIDFRVQPVTDIHLKSHLRWELEANGNVEYVYIMAVAALLTLLIACINFMNLMTAKSVERAKEIGIRKTMGALRKQLSVQFIGESILVTGIALVFAVLVLEASLPFYNSLTGQSLSLNYRETVPVLMLVAIVVGIGSGIYPAVILSAIQPQSILKGKFQTSARGNGLRNGLIVFQFAISMVLISGAVIIYNQLNFIQNKNLGFDKEEVLVIPMKNEHMDRRMEAIKNELSRVEGVISVSASSNMPGGQFNQNSIALVETPENDISTSEAFVDYDFQKTMNLEVTEGRYFTINDKPGSTEMKFVINETAARQLSNSSVVGKEINWYAYEDDQPIVGRVVGVVKDFHFQSLHEPLRPLLMIPYPAYNHLIVKLNTKNFEGSLAQIKTVYQEFENSFQFEFAFLDDQLDKQYESEARTGIIFSAFALIAIIIACFGLFGMAMLTFSQRMKEVSIRKVLGASVSGLVILLLRDFTRLIALAILLATPLTWWIMDHWLNSFIYQVGIHPVVFIVSGLALIAIAWLTLGYFTLKTTRVNPAEALKRE